MKAFKVKDEVKLHTVLVMVTGLLEVFGVLHFQRVYITDPFLPIKVGTAIAWGAYALYWGVAGRIRKKTDDDLYRLLAHKK